MSIARRGEITLKLAGKARVLRFNIGALEEIGEHAPLLQLFSRFTDKSASIPDVRVVLAAGLRGGGVTEDAAADIVSNAMHQDGFMVLYMLAGEALTVALGIGISEDEDSAPKKPKPPPEKLASGA